MSWFGDGTFRQDVLEDIEVRMEQHSVSRVDAVSQVAEVLAHLADSVLFKDAALNKLREQAVAEVRRELMAKING